jgi:hypothetical protein
MSAARRRAWYPAVAKRTAVTATPSTRTSIGLCPSIWNPRLSAGRRLCDGPASDASIVQDDAQERAVDLDAIVEIAAVFDESQLLELVHEEVHP